MDDRSAEQITELYEQIERVAFDQETTVENIIAALAARIGCELRPEEGAF